MGVVGGYAVYLKLNVFDRNANDLTIDTIPLRVNTVQVNVARTVPNFAIPLSSLARGESITVGADLGMAAKTITISGFITDTNLRRSHSKSGSSPVTRVFTAMEIAQMIASNVDSAGIAKYQNINELTIFIDSAVDSQYGQRGTTSPLYYIDIPLNFASRGNPLEKDNENVPFPATDFPDSSSAEGIKGFIESFDFTLDSETVEVAFNLNFKQANIFPSV
tara:strand:+ start:762 stop:1421 length:660 start_codon:yes stop_codon:yes gene_type:complete